MYLNIFFALGERGELAELLLEDLLVPRAQGEHRGHTQGTHQLFNLMINCSINQLPAYSRR